MDLTTLKPDLVADGFVVLPDCSVVDLSSITQGLGEIVSATDIKSKSGSKRLINGTDDIVAHNEQPACKYLVWFCQAHSAMGGDSFLVDGRDVAASLDSVTLSVLKNTYCPIRVSLDGNTRHPIYGGTEEFPEWYWVPWALSDYSYDNEQTDAINRLQQVVDSAERYDYRLRVGDIVVLDNHRMFHGRTAYTGERILQRFLLNAAG